MIQEPTVASSLENIPAPQSAPEAGTVLLTELRTGQSGRLLRADLLCDECDLLSALGMTDRCRIRVCKAGDPWIIQVHSTRIGLAQEVAVRIHVIPEPGF